MARPRIFDDHALTPAERMRHYRARKKQVRPKTANRNEVLASMTKAQQAKYIGKSVRSWYYVSVFIRDSEIEWDDDVVDGKHGKIGIAFLAEVCKYGTRESQQLIHDRIKTAGAKAGRALWSQFLKEG